MTDILLLGRFRVEKQIGQGGMSRVYRAIDEWTDAVVAVKVLREDLGADEEFARRFEREAQAAEAMSHENIVSLIDVGEQDGHRFLIMEYVAGITLKALIQEYGRIGPEHAVAIAVQICRALRHAHGQKIIHRDIKPQNILVQEDGMIKVADFGIARALNADTVTAADAGVLGSVHYISPEQARGGWTDEKSDLYSLGVVLYEMMIGHPPFEGEAPYAIALAHMQEEPVPPRTVFADIPQAIEDIILRAMDKDKAWRYDDAAEMEDDLLKALKAPGGGFVRKKPIPEAHTQFLPAIREDGLTAAKNGGRAEPKHVRRWGAVALGAVVLAAVILLAGSAVGFDWFTRTITVPGLIGMTDAQAEETILGLGLEPNIIDEYTLEAGIGYVFDQSPGEGRRVSAGWPIQISVSLGAPEIVMIDVSDMTEEAARQALEELRLVVAQVHQDFDAPTVAEGRVSRQSPLPNEIILAGEAVELWVSVPLSDRPVPDVVNLAQEDAVALLEKNGFQAGEVTERIGGNITPGIVVRQNPQHDVIAPVGSRVDLVISQPPYIKAWTTVVSLPHSGMEVTVRLLDGEEVIREYEAVAFETSGEKTIDHNFEFEKPGTYTVEVLVNGKVERSESIFVEEQAAVP